MQSRTPFANDDSPLPGYKLGDTGDRMSELEILRAKVEALSHASAVLLGARLMTLDPATASIACQIFASPFGSPGERQAERGRRDVMLDTLEDIAERALTLARPKG